MGAVPAELSKLDLAIIAAGGPAAFKRWWDSIDDKLAKLRLAYDWSWRARPKQLPPQGEWSTWVCRCGRGWGKTLTGAQWIRWRVEKEGARNIALVAPTAADARDVMVEGPSGILAVSPPWNRPKYEPSKRRITWPNGAIATTFSADEPRSLRGPQFDSGWADELAHWKYLEEVWDNLQRGRLDRQKEDTYNVQAMIDVQDDRGGDEENVRSRSTPRSPTALRSWKTWLRIALALFFVAGVLAVIANLYLDVRAGRGGELHRSTSGYKVSPIGILVTVGAAPAIFLAISTINWLLHRRDRALAHKYREKRT